FAASVHTGTFGANGRSFGCGPGPEAGDAGVGVDPRSVRVTAPPRCSRYWDGICDPVNTAGLAPVGAGASDTPAAAGPAADSTSNAAKATTASKTITNPP